MTRGTRALPLGSPKQRALLALLLLHANELVPRERLIEELWGDAAPATVNAALNGYLSKLRRMLANGVGEEILATRTPGYVLNVSADQVDARRFEALLEEGRSALARGDAERAAATLREALSLWRGAALADLAYERFAQNEIGRLEELRLGAAEDRIEADLALGRHDALVAELEALVAENPYRERLRAQLILALYRSGRQAEALEEYRRAREAFLAELGIEPSPRLQELERAILRHDASLEAPAPKVPQPGMRLLPRGRRRRIVAIAAIGVVLAAAAAALAGLWGRSSASRAPTALVGNSVVVIDPKTNSVDRELPIGGRPAGVAVGEGSIWVGNRDDKTLLRIDPRTRRIVRTIGLGAEPSDIAVGAGSVWVVSETARSVLRVDPDSYVVAPPIRISRERDLCCGAKILVGRGQVFVSRWSALWRIDPSTNAAVTSGGPLVRTIAYGENALWAITGPEYDIIERIDPGTHKVVDRFPLGRLGRTQGYGCRSRCFEGGAGALWTASHAGGILWKIDPFIGRVTGSVDLGHIPADMATGEGGVWVVSVDGTVFRVDPEAETVVQRIWLGVYPPDAATSIAAGAGAVWVITLRP